MSSRVSLRLFGGMGEGSGFNVVFTEYPHMFIIRNETIGLARKAGTRITLINI